MKKVEQSINAYADTSAYDLDNKIILNYYPKRIIELVKNIGSDSLLECGIGHGYTANVFNSYFKKHVLLDADMEIIEKFRKRYPDSNAEIIETFFEDFDSDETFDVIVLGFILEHVDNPIEILKKYKTFLSSKGRLFVTVPNAEALNRRVGHAAGLLPDMWQLSESDVAFGHKRYYNVETIKYDCEQAGLKVKRIEGIYLKALATKQLLTLNLSNEIYEAYCEVGRNYPELCLGILIELE